MIGSGIQRNHRQREEDHKKNLYCIIDKEETVNLEVRYCDDFHEKMERARELHKKYYGEDRKVG